VNEASNKQRREEYLSRINRVIDHIESHLAEPLDLETLAGVACFSRFHFHRIFRALMGEPLGQFIQRLRLEKAANQLVANPKKSITAVALDCGFSGSDTFARAFRDGFGMSASEWRAGGYEEASKICKTMRKTGQEDTRPSTYGGATGTEPLRRRIEMSADNRIAVDAEVKDLPELHVAYVRHVGPYKGDSKLFEDLFNRLMRWAGPRGLLRFPETHVLSVYHDNPEITEEDKLRVSACITVPPDTPVEGEVGKMTVPGGPFVVAHFVMKSPDDYQLAWDSLMGGWMVDSGYQPDDRLCYELYRNDPKQDPDGKHVVDICVPVRPL
jgi:AraC family transcriptional regulator